MKYASYVTLTPNPQLFVQAVQGISKLRLKQMDENVLDQLNLPDFQAIELAQVRESEASLKMQLARQEEDLDILTAELIENQDQLLALYKLTRTIRSHLELGQMLSLLIQEATELVKAEGAFIVLHTEETHEVMSDQVPYQFLDERSLNAFVQQVKFTKHEVLLSIENVLDLPIKNIRNMFLMPVTVDSEILAVLGFLFKQTSVSLSPHLKLARVIADYAGTQIENGLLHQRTLQQAQLETELKFAARIQLQLLPQAPPQVPNLALAANTKPALSVGGDFFDFIFRENSPLTFVVGDVSGKGLSAAMIMAMARTVIRSEAKGSPTPQTVLEHSNEIMYDDFTELGMFATVFVGRYDPAQQELVYANAGHSPVIYCPQGGCATMLEADGPAMGVLPMNLSEDQILPFSSGDVLVVATDGFSEASNETGEMFGYARLLNLVETIAYKSANEIADTLFERINEFSPGHLQDDDQTLIVIKGTAAGV